ncbi:MAG: glycosyltransferase [Deltaproteobacteria bacterium]|nr:glycosyltransferase [Deltaproteobacteria bacterium]
MKLCLIGKLPPVKGGVARLAYQTVIALAAAGVEVHVVTNANEVEPCHRHLMLPEDHGVMAEALTGVHVHQTQTVFEPRSFHIPLSPAYETKLLSLAMDVIEEHDCDAVMGWYFQPYGVVAALAGQLLGKPVIAMHAGSDIGFLPDHPQLGRAYRRMIAQTDAIITGNSDPVLGRLGALGATERQLRFPEPGFNRLLPEFSKPLPFDVADYVPHLAEHYRPYATPHGPLALELIDDIVELSSKPLDADAPTIGVYGKAGTVKGTVELYEALERLGQRGRRFNFVQLACGRFPILDGLYRQLLSRPALAARSWVLPTVAPWRIPGYLDRCDITCFLENRFGIAFHTPNVPREILARGSCFVCSGEVANSGLWSTALDDGDSVVVVDDPRNIDDLAERIDGVLEDRERRQQIGEFGRFISEQIEPHATENHVANLIRKIIEEQ